VAFDPGDRYPTARGVRAALLALLGTDLLDTDTLSEHIGNLGLKPSKSWDLEVVSPDDADLLAQNQREIDEVLKNLDLPPGFSDNLLFIEKTAVDTHPPHSPKRTEASEPRVVEVPPDAGTEPVPVANLPSEDPTIPPSAATESLPPGVRVVPPPHPPRRSLTPKPASGRTALPNSSPHDAALPDPAVRETSKREPPPSPPPMPPLANPNEVLGSGMKLYDLAKKRDREEAVEVKRPEPARHVLVTNVPQSPVVLGERSEPIEAQIPRLERQIARLKEQLDKSRHDAMKARPEESSLAKWIAVAFLSAIIGIAGTLLLHRPHGTTSEVVLVAPAGGDLARPLAAYRETGNPSPKDTSDATGMLNSALEHLERKDIDGAEGLLEQCITVADLPDCHKMLGTLLVLTRNPAARTHFEQYLHIAPTAPDADEIRRALAGTK
jgi:hypothetical protein